MVESSFPGGAVDRNPLASAGITGSIPGPGGSHKHRATKPECHNYRSPHTESLCSAARDATAMRNPSTARKAQCDQKKKKRAVES